MDVGLARCAGVAESSSLSTSGTAVTRQVKDQAIPGVNTEASFTSRRWHSRPINFLSSGIERWLIAAAVRITERNPDRHFRRLVIYVQEALLRCADPGQAEGRCCVRSDRLRVARLPA